MSLNKVMLIGRLGRDPEVRYMPSGEAVCNFSIATSENWTDKQTGNKVERTEWHNITMYSRLAEIAGQYLKKGSQVYIEGKIQSRKYTSKDGIERTAYDIIANEMKMLGSKNDGYSATESYQDASSGFNNNHHDKKSAKGSVLPTEIPAAPTQRTIEPTTPVEPIEDIDDDIPF